MEEACKEAEFGEDDYGSDPKKYWRDAADIVKRGRRGGEGIETCPRTLDDAEIFWDESRQAIVIVNKDGKIETYFQPKEGPVIGKDYYNRECRKTPENPSGDPL